MPTTKRPKPKPRDPKPERGIDPMPSAPTDPAARREWVWNRNAQIGQHTDAAAYVQTMRDQYERNLKRPSDLPKAMSSAHD